jgi:ketosteroid isomerase-like protein
MPDTEKRSELERFYTKYIEAFNREDVEAFAHAFSFPYGWIDGARGLKVVADEQAHRRSFGTIMEGLKRRGWKESGVDRLQAWLMAGDLAMIIADVTRYLNDGTILEQVRACYTLRLSASEWKIVTVAEVRPPFLGPGDLPR